jgi:DNA-binding NarL/FixJ family response regulator
MELSAAASPEHLAAPGHAFETTVSVAVLADPIRSRQFAARMHREPSLVYSSRRSVEEWGRAGTAPPDAVLVFHESMGRTEAAGLQELRATLPCTAILVVLGDVGIRSIRRALQNGADGVIGESEAAGCVSSAVRAACAGQLVLPRSFRGIFQRPVLSPREKQILALVVMGYGNAAIAAKLTIAESTVKTHLTSCFAKLGVRSRSEATALILDPVGGFGLGVLAIMPAGGSDE